MKCCESVGCAEEVLTVKLIRDVVCGGVNKSETFRFATAWSRQVSCKENSISDVAALIENADSCVQIKFGIVNN